MVPAPRISSIYLLSAFKFPYITALCSVGSEGTLNPIAFASKCHDEGPERDYSLGQRTTGQPPVLVGANNSDSESGAGVAFSASWWCSKFVLVLSGVSERGRFNVGDHDYGRDVALAYSITIHGLGQMLFLWVMQYQEDPGRCECSFMRNIVRRPLLENWLRTQRGSGNV